MKKIALLITSIVCTVCLASAQFASQVTLLATFTQHQVDSVLGKHGVPSGVFPIVYGVKVYKVIYNTVSWDSTPTIASGLLLVPDHPACKSPMLSYQHGTTLVKLDVPSRLGGEWFIGLAGAAKGVVCVLPDYLGMGDSPGLHPYQHAHTEATAVIDLIRAAKEVADTVGAPVDDQLFLMGYSQGGHATMAAHQLIQEKLDNVMHVTASAPMSGAYDMSGTMAEVMLSDSTYPQPFYLPYLFFGYNEVYHLFTNPGDVMVSPYDTLLPPLFDGLHNGNDVNAVMPNVPKQIMQPYQIDSFRNDSLNFFKVRLRENDTYNWVPNSPINMYFCKGDKQVDYRNSIVAYQRFVQQGATLVDTINISNTMDHGPCAQFAILTGVNWLSSFIYPPLSATVSAQNVSSANATDGSATVSGVGGNPHYTYLWNTGDTTATVNGLAAGTYYITITDGNDCTKIDSLHVGVGTGIADLAMTNLRIYPNPAKDFVTVEWTSADDRIASVEMYDLQGRQAAAYWLPKGSEGQLWWDNNTAKGLYYLHIKTQNGKYANRKVLLF